jgi:hypothetical protein
MEDLVTLFHVIGQTAFVPVPKLGANFAQLFLTTSTDPLHSTRYLFSYVNKEKTKNKKKWGGGGTNGKEIWLEFYTSKLVQDLVQKRKFLPCVSIKCCIFFFFHHCCVICVWFPGMC